jgi:uncharacterized protein YggT (Ycf19 family)
MVEQVQHVREVNSDGGTVKTTRVVDDGVAPATNSTAVIAARIVWFITGVILVILAFRFAFVLLGANPANGFANFIYSVSHPFVAPFFGLFHYSLKYGISRFEVSTLVAMVVYALIGYGIARLLTIHRARY